MTIQPRPRTRAQAVAPSAAAPVQPRPRARAPSPAMASLESARADSEAVGAIPPRTRSRAPVAQDTSEAVATVAAVHRDGLTGAETVITDTIERRPVALPAGVEHVAHIRVGGGATIQPRQYEALRVDVSLTMPCVPTPDAIEEQYTRVAAWVEDKIAQQFEMAANGATN